MKRMAVRGAIFMGLAAGLTWAVLISANAAMASPPPRPKCGTAHAPPKATIRMGGNKITMGGDPTYACPGDAVQWNNSTNGAQVFQIVFSSDLFREGRTYMVPAGQSLTLNIPAGATPGDYKYSVCVTNCNAAGTIRLDPHIIVMAP